MFVGFGEGLVTVASLYDLFPTRMLVERGRFGGIRERLVDFGGGGIIFLVTGFVFVRLFFLVVDNICFLVVSDRSFRCVLFGFIVSLHGFDWRGRALCRESLTDIVERLRSVSAVRGGRGLVVDVR